MTTSWMVIFPDRMGVLFLVLFCISPQPFCVKLKVVVFTVQKNAVAVLKISSFCSTNGESAGVASRQCGVKLKSDGLTFGTLDYGCDNISLQNSACARGLSGPLFCRIYSCRPLAQDAVEVRETIRLPLLMSRSFAIGPSS